MKNYKQNLVKYLETNRNRYHSLADSFREHGNETEYNVYMTKACECSHIIECIKSPTYLEEFMKIVGCDIK